MHQTLVVTLALVHQLDKVLHQEVAAGAQNWLEEVVVVVMVEMGHCTIKRRDWIGDEAMQGHSNVWILHHRSIGFKMGSREIFRAIVWRTINLHWHATHHKDKHIEKERRKKRERERDREKERDLTSWQMGSWRERGFWIFYRDWDSFWAHVYAQLLWLGAVWGLKGVLYWFVQANCDEKGGTRPGGTRS